jgi:hypothetical protein
VIELIVAWLLGLAWDVVVFAWWQAPVYATALYALVVLPYLVAFLHRNERV